MTTTTRIFKGHLVNQDGNTKGIFDKIDFLNLPKKQYHLLIEKETPAPTAGTVTIKCRYRESTRFVPWINPLDDTPMSIDLSLADGVDPILVYTFADSDKPIEAVEISVTGLVGGKLAYVLTAW